MIAFHRSSLEAALNLASEGCAVFPCKARTKEPVFLGGFKIATTNPETIRRWFGGQDYNLAVRTGMASGIWALDIDRRHGGDKSLADLERKHGILPPTRTVKTADGWHLWWRTDCQIQSSTSRIAPGLDAKGDPGYVLVPPSIHPDGPVYKWLSTEPPVAAPEWLVRLTRPKPIEAPPPPRLPHAGSPGAYGAAALQREIEELSNVAPGGRNHALNRTSFRLHQLVAGGELDGAEVERRLIEACQANRLVTDDGIHSVLKTIRSAARAGRQYPRARRVA
jgi:hypothetical protein